jgi:hypothetical protein
VAVDRHVVGRIGKHHRRPLLAHQIPKDRDIDHIGAQHAMPAQQPQIAGLADCRPRRHVRQIVGGIGSRVRRIVERGDPQIDLAHLETRDLEAEIEAEQREVLELLY